MNNFNKFVEQKRFEKSLNNIFNNNIVDNVIDFDDTLKVSNNENITQQSKLSNDAEKYIFDNENLKDAVVVNPIDVNELVVALKSDPKFMSGMQPRPVIGGGLGYKEMVNYVNNSLSSLDNIGDVTVNNPLNGQVLSWSSTINKWIPTTVSAVGGGKVAVDLLSEPDYLGTCADNGVLRVSGDEITYTNGGNYIILGFNQYAISASKINNDLTSASYNPILFNPIYTSAGNPSWQEGLMFYDYENKTMALYNNEPDVVLQIGQELYIRVVNKTGEPIYNGDVVSISGAHGNRPKIIKSLSTSALECPHVMGIATHNILNNHEGLITVAGVVGDLNTSNFVAGDILYLSTVSAGKFTTSQPNAPYPAIELGHIIVAHNTQGKLLVHIQHPNKIVHLSDVNGTTPQDNYLLKYVSSDGYWDPSPLSAITKDEYGIFKTLSVGDVSNGNFTEIEPDGTIQLHGDAVVWDDLRFPASQSKLGSNLKPDYDFVENGLLFPQNDETERIYMLCQFPHNWKIGSMISPHFHYVQNVSAVPKFVMLYRIAGIGGQWGGTYTSAVSTSGVIPYTSGSIHQLIPFPDIQTSAFSSVTGVSSMMDIILYRQTGDGITGDILFKEFDIHIQIDTLGSRQEFIK